MFLIQPVVLAYSVRARVPSSPLVSVINHLLCRYLPSTLPSRASRVALAVNAGGGRGAGSIPGVGDDPLEEGTVAHSSLLAWRTPWTEQPGGLQSVASQSRT